MNQQKAQEQGNTDKEYCCGDVGGRGLASYNSFRYFVCGESEVWAIVKSCNKTEDLIQ